MTKIQQKIKITAVSYLNTKPFLYGLLNHPIADYIDLSIDIPSVCAEKLKNGQADLGLVPVAIIPELDSPTIISDYCIGTTGEVNTVCIYGEVPIQKMTHIYLDHHSRTSVALAQILLRDYWKLQPTYLTAIEGYHHSLSNTIGGVVIGDKTIGLSQKYEYVYDLGSAWKEHTGLPFVFAAWVSNRSLPKAFITAFNTALKQGIEKIPQLIYILPTPQPEFDLNEYYTKYISYNLSDAKRKALDLFLSQLPTKSKTDLMLNAPG